MDVALATRINDILNKNGVPSVLDHTRDYDHGVFVPLKLMYLLPLLFSLSLLS